MPEELVRIKHWQQETVESGRYVLSALMTKKAARILLNSSFVEMGKIVSDSEYEYRKDEFKGVNNAPS